MNPSHPPDPLGSVIKRYLSLEGFPANWPQLVLGELRDPRFPGKEAQFRRQLAEAIKGRTITPARYEQMTGEDFDSQEDLDRWLREVWQQLFGDDPIQPT